MIFPSVEWFEALAAEMETDRRLHEHVGEIDTTCVIAVFDAPAGDFHVRLVFEEFSLIDVAEVGDDFDPASVDFVLEGDYLDWQEMIDNIKAHGKPDREHTLNYLSLPGTPLRCWSPEPRASASSGMRRRSMREAPRN